MSIQDSEFINFLAEKMCEYFKEAVHRAIQDHVFSQQRTDETGKSSENQNESISIHTVCASDESQEREVFMPLMSELYNFSLS
jgi:hypothetical protein